MRKYFLLLLLIFCFLEEVNSQTDTAKIYKYTFSSSLNFEMRIPASWNSLPTSDATGFFQTFIDTNYLSDKKNKNCLDSAIVYLKYIDADLSTAMNELGFANKGSGIYMIKMNEYISVAVGFGTKKNNYVGLDCAFKTNAICLGGKVKKGAAEMRYLLFSNGKATVCILNNGVPLSDRTATDLINSFIFK
jgi:hypothetical protein